MCKSKALGGRRCAAHTREPYQNALSSALSHAGPNYNSVFEPYSQETPPKVIADLVTTAIDYASTPTGNEDIKATIEEYSKISDFSEIVEILKISQGKGLEILEDARERESEIKSHSKTLDSSAIDETEIRNALETLDLMVALGGDVPAPAGSKFWKLIGVGDEGHTNTIGYYSTKEKMTKALSNFLYNELLSFRDAPWGCYTDIKDPIKWKEMAIEYEKTHDLDEVKAWYSSVSRRDRDMFQQFESIEIDYNLIAKPSVDWKEDTTVIKPRPMRFIDRDSRVVTIIE